MAREREGKGKKRGRTVVSKASTPLADPSRRAFGNVDNRRAKRILFDPLASHTSDFSKNNKLSVDEMRRQLYICGAVGAGAQY